MNEEETTLIGDAWLIGKENYLRAWSYFFKVAHTAGAWTGPKVQNDLNAGDSPEKQSESGDNSAGGAFGNNDEDGDSSSGGPGGLQFH